MRSSSSTETSRGAAEATRQAIQDGVDVVYQGVLVADGLARASPTSSMRQADGTYEALDTKLARHAKPAYILQLCFYTEQLARMQGREPEHIHVLLGSGERQSFRPQRVRRLRAARPRAARASSSPTRGATDAVPVRPLRASATSCRSATHWWDEVDHLCRVAGLCRRADREARGRPGSRRSPGSRGPSRPRRASTTETFEKLRGQAGSSSPRRETGEPVYELLDPRAGAGFALLPDPSPGDLFFDIEGNPFWDEEGSLEYLWGVLDAERRLHAALGRTTTRPSGARSRRSSTSSTSGSRDDPDMHVYHYAAYEITALRG